MESMINFYHRFVEVTGNPVIAWIELTLIAIVAIAAIVLLARFVSPKETGSKGTLDSSESTSNSKDSRKKRSSVTLIILIVIVFAIVSMNTFELPFWLKVTIESTIGLLLGLSALALVSPFLANVLKLTNDPQRPKKLALLTGVRPGQTKAKMRQGKFIGFIRDKGPEFSISGLIDPWYWFDRYVWFFGYRLIGVPPFQTLEVYDLPRFDKYEEVIDGKEVPVFITRADKSDHVRTLPFTFFFMVSGAEIQTIPFTIQGSCQARIRTGGEYQTFFNTDSWGVFFNQALAAVIRGVVRSGTTLDDVIGSAEKDIWASESKEESTESPDTYQAVSSEVLRRLKERTFTFFDGEEREETISEIIGLNVLSVEITDFVPEIDDEEAKQIRQAIRGRQIGRGRALEGQGEAGFQEKVLEIASTKGEFGHTSMLAESLVRASKEGQLNALAAGFLQNLVKGGKE